MIQESTILLLLMSDSPCHILPNLPSFQTKKQDMLFPAIAPKKPSIAVSSMSLSQSAVNFKMVESQPPPDINETSMRGKHRLSPQSHYSDNGYRWICIEGIEAICRPDASNEFKYTISC
jgi:hypothetical protein